MLVTVVRIDEHHAMFAPHGPGATWLVLDRYDDDGDPEPGAVGELDQDDGGFWLFEAITGQVARLCKLRAVGGPEKLTFELRDKSLLDLAGYGLEPALKNKAAATLNFWRLEPPSDVLGHFDHPDLAEWATGLAQEKAGAKVRATRAAALEPRRRQRAKSQHHFVNPYTFVPFPEQPPVRTSPAGHHTLAPHPERPQARFQGRITARLVARSPLLVRNIGSAAPVEDGTARAPRTPDGRLFVPGSSLHGALRSLHETLTGSCLRVFDPDFVPVYRDVASGALRKGWGLGVVEATDDRGRPIRITRCSETRWVHLDTLATATKPVETGQRFQLNDKMFAPQNGRDVYSASGPVSLDPAGEWIVLVTDDAARDTRYPHYCAVGRIPAHATSLQVTDRAWTEFQQAAEGSKQWYANWPGAQPDLDGERTRLNRPGVTLADVLGDETRKIRPGLGRWLRPRPWLHPGQVVWLAPSTGRYVGGIAMSYLWRTTGRGPAGDRLRPELPAPGMEACHDPDDLCQSCRMFGSADTRDVSSGGVDRRVAEQRSYRGHVRVLDAVLESGDVLDAPVTLPATGSPRPGSGQFYLEDPNGAKDTLEYQKPRNRWGVPDATTPRRLRGRKFYWQTDPTIDEQRCRWRRHEHAPAGDQVELVARGSTYRIELTFDGLTASEIGGLVATLQPHRLFATRPDVLPYPTESEPQFAFHVGGGKPIGLGSCQIDEVAVTTDNIESRYLSTAARLDVDPDDVVAAFSEEHAEQLAGIWQHVAAALHTDHVDSRIVSYPTSIPWDDDNGRCSGKNQHEAFRWFQNSTGEDMRKGRPKPFVTLPDLSDIAQGLPTDLGSDR